MQRKGDCDDNTSFDKVIITGIPKSKKREAYNTLNMWKADSWMFLLESCLEKPRIGKMLEHPWKIMLATVEQLG